MKNSKAKIQSKVAVSLATVMLAGGVFLLSGCGVENQNKTFNQTDIVISAGELISLQDLVSSGFGGEIVSSNTEIASVGNDSVKFLTSGQVYLYAVENGKEVGYVKVFVKPAFKRPENIKIDENGKITWNVSSALVNDQLVKAKYQIKISGEGFNETTYDCQTNSFVLTQKGIFDVSVKAVAGDLVDESDWSEVKTVYNAVMDKAEEIAFEADTRALETKGRLSWKSVENAKYNVIVNNILYEAQNNYIDIDLGMMKSLSVKAYVEVLDRLDEKVKSKSEEFLIQKLAAPEITYKDGMFSWGEIEGASGYAVKYVKAGSGVERKITTENNFTYLEGADEGDYTLYVQALGQGAVANSSIEKFEHKVAKLGAFDADFTITEDGVKIEIESNSANLKRFAIFSNGVKIDEVTAVADEDKFKAEKNVALSVAQRYDLCVQALPLKNGDQIIPIGDSEYIAASEKIEYTVYKIATITNIKHDINELGESVLSFDKPENADTYVVKVNNHILEGEVEESAGKININIGILNREELGIVDGGNFNFEITSTRQDGHSLDSLSIKNLKVLSVPTSTSLSGGYLEGNSYAWQVVLGVGSYKYSYFKTVDDDFDTDGIEEQIFETETAKTADLKEGFYVLKVFALSGDYNEYLNSANALEDEFIVSQKILTPEIETFTSQDGNHSIRFFAYGIEEDEDYDRSYEIYVKDGLSETLVGTASIRQNDGSYVFNFDEGYNLVNKSIKIRLVCTGEVDKKVYLASDYAVLNIEKLAVPQIEDIVVTDNQILSVSLRGDAEKVVISYNGDVIEDEGEPLQEVDLKDFGVNFTLRVCFDGYYDYHYNEQNRFTEGNFCIASDSLAVSFVRGLTPANLKYEDSEFSLVETGPYEKFLASITIKTLNDLEGKTWEFETEETSFDFNDLKEIINSAEFNTYYNQKTEAVLSVSSFANRFDADLNAYTLPSANNYTLDKGVAEITVNSLNAVTDLNYSRENNRLVWTSENPESGTIYDIYLNGSKIGEGNIIDVDEGVASYFFSLAGFEFVSGMEYNFTTVARSRNYFDSRTSNRVVIEKVASIDSVVVSSSIDDKTPKLIWSISAENLEKVQKINVNETDYLLPTTSVLIDSEVTEYKFKVIARNGYKEGSTNYVFMDSDETIFTLLNGKNNAYVADSQIDDGAIRWTKYIDDDIQGVSFENFKDNLMYKVQACYNGSSVVRSKNLQAEAIENIDENDKNFIELKDSIFLEIQDSADVEIYSYLNDYTLNRGGRGLYICEKMSTQNLSVERLDAVTNQDYSLEAISDLSTHTLEDEEDRKIVIAWDYDDLSASFEVKYDDNTFETDLHYFEISQGDLLKNATVFVRALSNTKVPSEYVSVTLNISSELNATLSDRGLFDIDSAIGDTYLISIDCGEYHNDIVTNSNSIDIFDELRNVSSTLLSEKIKIKYAAVGEKDAILRENEVVEKNLLIKKDYVVYGNKIYFDADFASSVVINYKNNQNEIVSIEINEKKLLNTLTTIPLGIDVLLSKQVLDDYGVDQSLRQGKYYFEFELPEAFEGGKNFNYYYKKPGYVDSWFDRTLTEDFIASTQETLSDISDVSLCIENSGAVKINVAGSPQKTILDVYYTSTTKQYYIGKVEYFGSEFSFAGMEMLFDSELKPGTYHIVAKTTKTGLTSSQFAYSDEFEFDIKKLENTVSNIQIDNRGVLVWDDSSNSKYVLKQENLSTNVYYNVDTKYFDLTTVEGDNKTDFSIANYGNVEFATTGTSSAVSALDVDFEFVIPSFFHDLTLDETDFTAEIESVSVSNDAVVTFTFDDTLDTEKELSIYFEYNKKIYQIDYETTDSDLVYKTDLVSIYDLIKDDMIGNVEYIDVFATSLGCIKSPMTRVNISIKTDSVTTENYKAATFDDYVDFDLPDVTHVWVRVKDQSGNVLSVAPYEIESGYLVLQGEHSGNYVKAIYDEAPSDPQVETRNVKAINMTRLLEDIDSSTGSYVVEIAPVLNGGALIGFLSPIEYTRLVEISDFEVSGDYIEWTNPETNVDYFANRLVSEVKGSKTCQIIDLSNEKISHQEFVSGRVYNLAITAVSDRVGVLSSKQVVLEEVRKAQTLTSADFEIVDGSIFLKWNVVKLTAEEKAVLNARGTEVEVAASNALFDEIFKEGNLFKILEMIDLLKNNKPYDDRTISEKVLNAFVSSPVSFRLKDIKEAKIELKFKAQNVSEKTVTVDAVDILERFDTITLASGTNAKYLDILSMIRNVWAINFPELNASYNNLLGLLVNPKYFIGVANDKILFDEMGQGEGENVDAGIYSLFAREIGQPNLNLLQGEDSRAFEETEVLTSPRMETAKVDVTNGDSSDPKVMYSTYYIKFKPIENEAGESKESYKLVLKQDSLYYENFVCDIEYDSGLNKWIISNGANSFELRYENDYIWIPLSSKDSDSGLDEIIDVKNIKYRASIYACGSGNEINGKSNVINVTYLGINKNSINVSYGRLSWTSYDYQGVGYETKIIYKRASDGIYSVENLPYLRNNTDSILSSTGVYDSVCLMVEGKISEFDISVDSEVVMIENVTRLERPNLSTYDGYIKISDTNDYASSTGYVRNYRISNNASGSMFLITGEVNQNASYQAGVKLGNADDLYKDTEFSATQYNISSVGSTGSLTFKENKVHDRLGSVSVYALNDSANVFLRSTTSEIQASMLSSTELEINDEGDFEWEFVTGAAVSGLQVKESQKIVYQVEITSYEKSSDGTKDVYNQKQHSIYYTERTSLSSNIIDDASGSLYYRIAVYAMVFNTAGISADRIETVDGKYYYKTTGSSYQESTIKVLRSGKETPEEDLIGKIETPEDIQLIIEDDPTNTDIKAGNIIFTHNGDEDIDYAVYISTEKDFSKVIKKVEGSFKDVGENKIVFTLTEDLDTSTEYYYWVKATSKEKNRFASNAVCSSRKYYQMPKITEDDFVISQYGGRYELDFSSYKSNSRIKTYSGTKNYYDIHVKLLSSDGGSGYVEGTFVVDPYEEGGDIIYIVVSDIGGSAPYTYYIKPGSSITMTSQAVKKDGSNARAINSIESNFEFRQTAWGEDDKVSYDEDSYTFSWTHDRNDVSFEVEIKAEQVIKEDSQKITYREVTRTYSNITSKSFTPDFIGTIKSFSVKVKGGKNDLQSGAIYYNQEVNIGIFEGGDGTEENPYKIASAEHLQNLSLKEERVQQMRSYEETVYKIVKYKQGGRVDRESLGSRSVTLDSTYYFKQTQDITAAVDGKLIETFKGVYDGDGYVLQINGSGVININQYVGYETTNYTYGKGFALIQNVTSSAEIKNVDLKVNYNYSTQNNNVIISGLALVNNGLISGVELTELNFNFNQAIANEKNVAISGIVGINKGRVVNCVNSADITVNNTFSGQDSARMIFGSLIFVNTGTVTNSSNQGDISLSTQTQNMMVQVAGLACLNFGGTIDLCYNTGNMTITNASTTQTAGLICYTGRGAIVSGTYSNAGRISYSWNDGNINGKNGNTAGIVYRLNETRLDNIISCGKVNNDINSYNLFFKEAAVGENSNCYAPGGFSDTMGLTSVVAIAPPVQINHVASGKVITITYEDNVYSVSLN